jgi:hypothetical protein
MIVSVTQPTATWLLVVFVAFSGAACGGVQSQDETAEGSLPEQFVRVEHEHADLDMGPPQLLTVEGSGAARYVAYTNNHHRESPGIGIYTNTLERSQVEALFDVLADPPFQTWEDHRGRVPLDAEYQRIRLITGQVPPPEKMYSHAEPIPAQAEAALARLDEVVDLLLRHPQRTVKMVLHEVSADAEGRLRGVITFLATGTEGVRCRSPVDVRGAPGSGLRLTVWGAGEVNDVVVERVDLAPDQDRDRLAGPLLDLAAGGSALFTFEVSLAELPPGDLQALVIYRADPSDMGGHGIVAGELCSLPVVVDR